MPIYLQAETVANSKQGIRANYSNNIRTRKQSEDSVLDENNNYTTTLLLMSAVIIYEIIHIALLRLPSYFSTIYFMMAICYQNPPFISH